MSPHPFQILIHFLKFMLNLFLNLYNIDNIYDETNTVETVYNDTG